MKGALINSAPLLRPDRTQQYEQDSQECHEVFHDVRFFPYSIPGNQEFPQYPSQNGKAASVAAALPGCASDSLVPVSGVVT